MAAVVTWECGGPGRGDGVTVSGALQGFLFPARWLHHRISQMPEALTGSRFRGRAVIGPSEVRTLCSDPTLIAGSPASVSRGRLWEASRIPGHHCPAAQARPFCRCRHVAPGFHREPRAPSWLLRAVGLEEPLRRERGQPRKPGHCADCTIRSPMDGVGAGEDRERCPAWAGRTQTPHLWVPPSHFLSRGSHPYDGVCKVTCGPKRAHLSSSAQRK